MDEESKLRNKFGFPPIYAIYYPKPPATGNWICKRWFGAELDETFLLEKYHIYEIFDVLDAMDLCKHPPYQDGHRPGAIMEIWTE